MEEAFDGFDPWRVASYDDCEIDRLLSDARIIRNAAKVMAVVDNANFLRSIASKHGSVGAFFAEWPNETFVDLLAVLANQGTRLGGLTGQRVLRMMGRDGFVLSPDVIARLVAEGVVDKPPSSKRDLAATQQAFNHWSAQSGRGLTQISQILAFSV
jgi:3-methyladenine DNA glycosylase Tag